jgi:hypothetical protein
LVHEGKAQVFLLDVAGFDAIQSDVAGSEEEILKRSWLKD